MRKKLSKEERESKSRQEKEELSRPVTQKDLEALLEHFGQTKNLPK